MPHALKAATVFGTIPLLLATIIYTIWRFTRWAWLETAGFCWLFLGLASVVIGIAIVVRHLWREFRASGQISGKTWLQAALISGVLLVNFPVAGFFTLSAINLVTRYTVHVINNSGSPIENFVVTGPGICVELGSIADGDQLQRHLHFAGDGSLDFTARQNRFKIAGQLEGYVTGGMGGETTIQMLPGGKFELQKRHG